MVCLQLFCNNCRQNNSYNIFWPQTDPFISCLWSRCRDLQTDTIRKQIKIHWQSVQPKTSLSHQDRTALLSSSATITMMRWLTTQISVILIKYIYKEDASLWMWVIAQLTSLSWCRLPWWVWVCDTYTVTHAVGGMQVNEKFSKLELVDDHDFSTFWWQKVFFHSMSSITDPMIQH